MRRLILAGVLLAALLVLLLAMPAAASAGPGVSQPSLRGPSLAADIGIPCFQVSVAQTRANPWVYITDTGKKYHCAGCRYLRKSKHRIRLKSAKAQGYKPCSICKPPR